MLKVQGQIDPTLDLFEEIERLKKERNAVIMAHYYQEPDIQDIADVLGDSLLLAREAQKTDADVIVLCGVHFMAETAKILNPNKVVVLPDLEAGCSLADSCPPDRFQAFKDQYPDHTVVSYVNTTASIKALSDWICTSGNAAEVVKAIPADEKIIFGPDVNLGRWVQNLTGREMKIWEGSCLVHETFNEQRVLALMAEHPRAELIARLVEYQRFKEAASSMGERPLLDRDVYAANAQDLEPVPDAERKIEVGVFQLVEAFRQALARAGPVGFAHEVEADPVTVHDRMVAVMEILDTCESCDFARILEDEGVASSRPVVVASFLAILELARLQALGVYQGVDAESVPIGPIHLRRRVEAQDGAWKQLISDVM